MGTGGSFAGGGGGGGLAGSSPGGSYHFSNGHPTAATLSRDQAHRQVRHTLAGLSKSSKTYYRRQLFGPLIEGVFRDLFLLYEYVKSDSPVTAIIQEFGVTPSDPFVMNFGNALMARHFDAEPDERIRSTARMVLDAFLFRTLGNDSATFNTGNCQRFVEAADRVAFQSLSGHFLSILLWQVVRRELSGLSGAAEIQLKHETQRLADNIVARFERDHLSGQTDYRDLMAVIRGQEKWFRKALS